MDILKYPDRYRHQEYGNYILLIVIREKIRDKFKSMEVEV